MGWAERMGRMDERKGAYRVLVWKPEAKNHFEDNGRLILKYIFKT
jgi:hypothetical protein